MRQTTLKHVYVTLAQNEFVVEYVATCSCWPVLRVLGTCERLLMTMTQPTVPERMYDRTIDAQRISVAAFLPPWITYYLNGDASTAAKTCCKFGISTALPLFIAGGDASARKRGRLNGR